MCVAMVPNTCLPFCFQRHFPLNGSVATSRARNLPRKSDRDDLIASRECTLCLSVKDSTTEERPELQSSATSAAWAKHALLISSFTDGILASPDAQSFLKYSLASSLLSERVRHAEISVRDSVMASPCNGPNMEAFNALETYDQISEIGDADKDYILSADRMLRSLSSVQEQDERTTNVRLLYIPTAMYALNPSSSSTPGKQRQRARADGKKRRNQVARHLEDLLKPHLPGTYDVIALGCEREEEQAGAKAGTRATTFL